MDVLYILLARKDLILAIIGTILGVLTIIAAVLAVIQLITFQTVLITGYAIVLGFGLGIFEFEFTRKFIFGFGRTKLERGVYQLTSSGVILALNHVFGFVVGAFVITLGLINVLIWLLSERHLMSTTNNTNTNNNKKNIDGNRGSSEFDSDFLAKFQQHQSAYITTGPINVVEPKPQKSSVIYGPKNPQITEKPAAPPKKSKSLTSNFTIEENEFKTQNLQTPEEEQQQEQQQEQEEQVTTEVVPIEQPIEQPIEEYRSQEPQSQGQADNLQNIEEPKQEEININ